MKPTDKEILAILGMADRIKLDLDQWETYAREAQLFRAARPYLRPLCTEVLRLRKAIEEIHRLASPCGNEAGDAAITRITKEILTR